MEIEQRDHLTQLLTRAAFDAELFARFSAATSEQPAALVLADIDHFKKVNDNHGHPAGDAALKELAGRLQHVIEGKGTVYRYGGEEFAAILPNHTGDEAVAVAERARRAVEALTVRSLSVTSSYGVAVVPLHASSPDQWLDAADRALYDAKGLGRNSVRLSGEPPPESDRVRKPVRRRADPGTLSDESKEKLRVEILRGGPVLCPVDQIPLAAQDLTTFGELGRSFMVHCPGCGSVPNSQDRAVGDFRRRLTSAFGRRQVES